MVARKKRSVGIARSILPCGDDTEESKYHHKVNKIQLFSYEQPIGKRERGSVAAVLSG